uniref:Uncharacterized protein n=1 Tax=Utricularia reniformis TaxID=192314 RepID=A0A1Y0B2U5_9LAMI|nr:hypothetical protein AEK19_MT1531 [Utricularia reniformis]ART31720.1 hypothetical protein AEK19_MT1531 [Utricularia reniformis]
MLRWCPRCSLSSFCSRSRRAFSRGPIKQAVASESGQEDIAQSRQAANSICAKVQ